MPMLTPTSLESIQHTDVLANYGQAMEYVQAFEHTLKSILLFHRAIEKSSAGPIDDASFQRLLDEPRHTTLGRVLRDLLLLWERPGLNPFPEQAEEVLLSMVRLRNRLAHSYLVENSRALPNAEGRRMMIAELHWYAEAFMSFEATMQRWLRQLAEHLGVDLSEVEKEYGSIVEQVALESLRTNLNRVGISLPDPPHPTA